MTYVNISGPLFDGRAAAAVTVYRYEVVGLVADEGANMVASISSSSFRNPTGYFVSKIQTDRRGFDATVSDPVIYGPWLEGVGSRNKTTRFKGYAMFRRATQQLNGKARQLAEQVLQPYLRRMGGA